jgi:DNA-binding response OmpR family regulator
MAEPVDRKRRVLVVTDDEHIRDEATYGFPPDIEVELSEDARSALSASTDSPPDVVIVAIRTGNAGGFALARDMSQRAALNAIPVFMLLEREQDRWLAAQAGAALACAKPLNPGELVTATLGLLGAGSPV